jgi:glycosyltransferase involved in cell wall biosynthesis
MAARVPLVVTNVGALPEVVGPDAITVPPGDARALADALAQVLAGPDPVRVERLYQRWAERFSPEAGRRAVAELLEGLRPADR